MTVTDADDCASSKQSKHVRKRRRNGLCGREGCDVVTGDDYRCPQHREEHNKRMQKIRAAKKAETQVAA